MQSDLIQLKVLLPFKVFTTKQDVEQIIALTPQGFVGLLPHRLDCVMVITPGILTWQSTSEGEVVIAVDHGILVKTGMQVTISVRNAIGGADLNKLHTAISEEFIKESEQEKQLRLSLAKLESGFIHRFMELQH